MDVLLSSVWEAVWSITGLFGVVLPDTAWFNGLFSSVWTTANSITETVEAEVPDTTWIGGVLTNIWDTSSTIVNTAFAEPPDQSWMDSIFSTVKETAGTISNAAVAEVAETTWFDAILTTVKETASTIENAVVAEAPEATWFDAILTTVKKTASSVVNAAAAEIPETSSLDIMISTVKEMASTAATAAAALKVPEMTWFTDMLTSIWKTVWTVAMTVGAVILTSILAVIVAVTWNRKQQEQRPNQTRSPDYSSIYTPRRQYTPSTSSPIVPAKRSQIPPPRSYAPSTPVYVPAPVKPKSRFPMTARVSAIRGHLIYVKGIIDDQMSWLKIDDTSANTGQNIHQEPWLGADIVIKFAEMREQSGSTSEGWVVLDYIISDNYPPKYLRIVAVHKKTAHTVTVLSRGFESPVTVSKHNTSKIKEQDFLMARYIVMPPFTEIAYGEDTVELIAAPESTMEAIHFTDVSPLDWEDQQTMDEMCRNLPEDEMTLQDANLYILDPFVAAARLEQLEDELQAAKITVTVPVKLFVEGHNNVVTCRLNASQVKDCINGRSGDTWRVGTKLSFRYSALWKYERRHQEADIVVDNIKFDSNGATVRFVGVARSRDLFNVLQSAYIPDDATCTIGPSESDANQQSMIDIVEEGFACFFEERRPMFDVWIGRKTYVAKPISNLHHPFMVNNRPLDPSQLVSMRTAAATPGWTCVAAPPGSGKTFMISALVAARNQESADTHPDRIVIAAATNVAVTNAIDAVHQNFPEIKVCREYSVRTASDVPAKSAELSLRIMTKNAHKYIDATGMRMLDPYFARLRQAEDAMKRPCSDVASGVSRVSALKGAEKALRIAFLVVYNPLVYGSTVELVARRVDEDATHLILDEAAQISPLAALALYISMPNLKKITLLGDSQQLGPYCGLEEDGAARRLLMQGELSRQQCLNSSTKQKLNTVYRCHPRIVDLLLCPLYGPSLEAGTSAGDRDFVRRNSLPAARDGSPFLFVHIGNSNGESGTNKKELEVAMKLLGSLENAGISGEDVAVITHHRAQREMLIRSLRGTGSIGTMELPIGVHTIESFQGREAKVVIVLTTKTCKSRDEKTLQHALSFVSNPNRETVALSRAQHGLYVLGDWSGLARTPFWGQFANNIKWAGAIVNENFDYIDWFDEPQPRKKLPKAKKNGKHGENIQKSNKQSIGQKNDSSKTTKNTNTNTDKRMAQENRVVQQESIQDQAEPESSQQQAPKQKRSNKNKYKKKKTANVMQNIL